MLLRESVPRQVDKKSGVPKEERRVWNSQGGEKDKHFFLHSLVLVTYNPELMMITQQNNSA